MMRLIKVILFLEVAIQISQSAQMENISKEFRHKEEIDPLSDLIPGQYIIALHISSKTTGSSRHMADDFAKAIRENFGLEAKISSFGEKKFVFVNGSDIVISEIRKMSAVRYIEPNRVVRGYGCTSDTVSNLWGMDRIDQRDTVEMYKSNEYSYSGSDNGADVVVYVADSGIDITLSEFGGRARWGFTTSMMDGDADLDGHGTHVAGTIGSSTYGVAKNVNLVAVKVLDGSGSGSTSGIIEGLEWIKQDFHTNGKINSIINLSLGGSGSYAFDEALQELIDAGIPAVVAAGNDYNDACLYSPARLPDAITVGALNNNDILPAFTNYGPCLDIFAPGVDILSTNPGGIGLPPTYYLDGTSMAAPHVTGVLARYLSTLNSQADPPSYDVKAWMAAMATRDAIIFEYYWEETSPDRLLYINCFEDGGWDFAVQPDLDLPDNGVGQPIPVLTCYFVITICYFII